MSFYVTLPSNSSTNFFDNTISNFTTQLHLPISFDRPYEVALVEFSYDHYWRVNIGQLKYYHSDNVIFIIDIDHRDGDSIQDLFKNINDNLNQALIQYEINKSDKKPDEVQVFTKTANTSFQNKTQILPFLKFNTDLHQLEVSTVNKNDNLRFEGLITSILNLDMFINTTIAPIKIDRKYENGLYIINNMYIYTDIVKYQYIGDTLSPLLRTVSIPSSKVLSTESVIYDSPHYLPVNKSSIDTINIKIKDEQGQNIKFERGKSIIKLHFRPIIYYGFQ